MLALTIFEVLLFEGRSVLGPVQRVPRNERVKFSVKNKKNVRLLSKLLEK